MLYNGSEPANSKRPLWRRGWFIALVVFLIIYAIAAFK